MQAADGGEVLLVLFQGFQPNMQRDQRSSHFDIQKTEREGVGEARREGEHAYLSRPSAYVLLESRFSFFDGCLWTSQTQLGVGFPNLQVLLKSIKLIVKVNPHTFSVL